MLLLLEEPELEPELLRALELEPEPELLEPDLLEELELLLQSRSVGEG